MISHTHKCLFFYHGGELPLTPIVLNNLFFIALYSFFNFLKIKIWEDFNQILINTILFINLEKKINKM